MACVHPKGDSDSAVRDSSTPDPDSALDTDTDSAAQIYRSCTDGGAAFLDDGTYFSTIQRSVDAVDALPSGGTVHVCPGTHEENLDLEASIEPITIIGDANGTSVIDAGGYQTEADTVSVVYTPGERDVALTLLTLTGGTGHPTCYEGDYDCQSYGGGIVAGGDLTLDRVTVTENTAFWDSAIAVSGGVTVSITDSRVLGNTDRWCDDYPDRCAVVALGSGATDEPWLTFTATNTTWEGNSPHDIIIGAGSTDHTTTTFMDVPPGTTTVSCTSETVSCTFE